MAHQLEPLVSQVVLAVAVEFLKMERLKVAVLVQQVKVMLAVMVLTEVVQALTPARVVEAAQEQLDKLRLQLTVEPVVMDLTGNHLELSTLAVAVDVLVVGQLAARAELVVVATEPLRLKAKQQVGLILVVVVALLVPRAELAPLVALVL
jgi:hypothetical protein